MTKICANIVGRNEEGNYLHQILKRVASQVDLITFTDDASTDGTAEIAESYGAKVLRLTEPTFSTNEGKLRTLSWRHLERQIEFKDKWYVLAIDCDEEMYETTHKLRDLANQDDYDVVNVDFYHMWNENQYRVDKLWAPHGSTRFFRYYPGGSFADRNLACGSEPTYVSHLVRQGNYFRDSGLSMKHLSYIKDEDKQTKYDRYASIDGGAFHANSHIESILDKDVVLTDWTL